VPGVSHRVEVAHQLGVCRQLRQAFHRPVAPYFEKLGNFDDESGTDDCNADEFERSVAEAGRVGISRRIANTLAPAA